MSDSRRQRRAQEKAQQAKPRNLARQVLINFTNAFLKFVITPLLRWTDEDNEKQNFFFLVIGNEYVTDVAFSNPEKLIVNAGMAIAIMPETAAMFEGIRTSYDIQLEDSLKDPDFEKAFQAFDDCNADGSYWGSWELEPE